MPQKGTEKRRSSENVIGTDKSALLWMYCRGIAPFETPTCIAKDAPRQISSNLKTSPVQNRFTLAVIRKREPSPSKRLRVVRFDGRPDQDPGLPGAFIDLQENSGDSSLARRNDLPTKR
jgi:hypothetical protein